MSKGPIHYRSGGAVVACGRAVKGRRRTRATARVTCDACLAWASALEAGQGGPRDVRDAYRGLKHDAGELAEGVAQLRDRLRELGRETEAASLEEVQSRVAQVLRGLRELAPEVLA